MISKKRKGKWTRHQNFIETIIVLLIATLTKVESNDYTVILSKIDEVLSGLSHIENTLSKEPNAPAESLSSANDYTVILPKIDKVLSGLSHIENTLSKEPNPPAESLSSGTSNRCKANHIHLASGAEPWNSMTVSFSTPCHPDETRVSVSYGINPFKFENVVYADDTNVRQYNHTSIHKRKIVFYQSDYIYHIPLTELETDKLYFYECHVDHLVDDGTNDDEERVGLEEPTKKKSKTIANLNRFRTSPLPGKNTNGDDVPLRFLLVGDWGRSQSAKKTARQMLRDVAGTDGRNEGRQASVVAFCVGDISYANNYHKKWDEWFDAISPLASRVPLMVSPGNHEIECDAVTGEIFKAYENRFLMPSEKEADIVPISEEELEDMWGCTSAVDYLGSYEGGNSYYTITYGTALVLVVNAFTSTKKGSEQYDYVLETLKNVNRDVTPWVFVMVHKPFYNTFTAHRDDEETDKMHESLEPLFVKYNVNMVFSGHVHGYMRSKNGLVKGKIEEKGPTYVMIGKSGVNEEMHYWKDTDDLVAARSNVAIGFGAIDLINNTHLKWNYVRNDGVVKDDDYIDNYYFR